MRAVCAIAGLCLLLGAAAPARGDAKGEREARALFKEANRLLETGDAVGAVDMYRAAYGRFASAKILLNLGTALRQLGRDAEAADTYERYLKDPKADPKRRAEVQKVLAELGARLGRLRITVSEPGARVTVDGKIVGASADILTVRVEPGRHAVVAEKDGFPVAATTITVAAGQEKAVELRLARAAVAPPAPEPPRAVIAPQEPSRAEPPRAAAPKTVARPAAPAAPTDAGVAQPAPRPARRGLLGYGAFARTDIDGQGRGALGAAGLVLGVGAHADLALGGLFGKRQGAYLGATAKLLTGEWRPLVAVGVPILFDGGARVGLHAAAGLEWSPVRHLGVFLLLGVEHFFSVPSSNFDKTLFVPTLGVTARL